MDWVTVKKNLPLFLKKYRYVILIVVIGLVLMWLPTNDSSQASPPGNTAVSDEVSLQEQLSSVLSLVDGAGKVRVVLTLSNGEETVYQTNDEYTTGSESGNDRINTVTVTDAQRNEAGLVRQVNPPKYLGAIVVSEGADSPSVRLAIAEAVARATGLGMDKISVLKMK